MRVVFNKVRVSQASTSKRSLACAAACFYFLCLCKESNKESTADFDAVHFLPRRFLGRNRHSDHHSPEYLRLTDKQDGDEFIVLKTRCRTGVQVSHPLVPLFNLFHARSTTAPVVVMFPPLSMWRGGAEFSIRRVLLTVRQKILQINFLFQEQAGVVQMT